MDQEAKNPLVRPRFLKVSTAAFVLLLPILIYTLWGYVEARRLASAIDEIKQKGEPITLASGTKDLTPDAARAARDYRAAAALASDFRQETTIGAGPTPYWFRVADAERQGTWPGDLAESLRRAVYQYRDVLDLADQAAALPFEGFRYPRTDSLLTSDLVNVDQLAALRAVAYAIDGKGNEAADSLYSAVRVTRLMQGSFAVMRGSSSLGPHLEFVLAHTRPSSDRLTKLGTAIGVLDQDDFLTRQFQAQRAGLLDQSRRPLLQEEMLGGWYQFSAPPWRIHGLTGQLQILAELLVAADAPWPQRIDEVAGLARLPSGFGPARPDARVVLESIATFAALQIAKVRCQLLAIAVERYKRDHAERVPEALTALVPVYLSAVPIDPFTGASLKMVRDNDGYAVYSVSTNRRDDGGQLGDGTDAGRYAPDLGVRIQPR